MDVAPSRFQSPVAADLWPLVLIAAVLTLLLADPSRAADPATALSNAESTAASAEGEIGDLEVELAPQRSEFATISEKASTAEQAASAAEAEVEQLHSQIAARAHLAKQKIASAERTHSEEEDDQEEQIVGGIASFLAALTIALIALAWGWFRATAPVAWLVAQRSAHAIGLTIGAGVALIIAGGALLGAGGVIGVIGGYVGFLGFILPTAFLLARHSAEVQRGQAKPWLRRERLPNWVTTTLAAVFGILAIASLGTAIFADGPEDLAISPELSAEASASLGEAKQQHLEDLEFEEAKLASRASKLNARRQGALKPLAASQRQLRQARNQLASAESDIGFYSRRLAAEEARQARQAEHEAQLTAEEAEEEAAEECNPNYSGCLDPTASDYDCEGGSGDGPLYTGTVEVIGYDEYGLDDDGDGIGCDP